MSSLNKATGAMSVFQINRKATATILEGAIVAYDTDKDECTNVSGAGAVKTIGVALNAGSSGDRINIGVIGIFPVLLVSGGTVANGDKLVTAGATGTVKTRTSETTVDLVGIAIGAHVAAGAGEFIDVLMTPGAYIA